MGRVIINYLFIMLGLFYYTLMRVRVSTGNIYIGVKLVFGEQNYFVKEKFSFCQFVKDHAEIKCRSI